MKTKKQLEKERKVFSDLTEDETEDLIKNVEDYQVPKVIETTKQDDNCRAKAMFILGELTQTNEIIKLIEELKEIYVKTEVSDYSKGYSNGRISVCENILTKIKGDGE